MKTFKIGGIHPSEDKLSAKSPIRQAGLPRQAVISLYQHIGAPAKPVVAKGDEVKVGMLIAEADGFVSVPIHSSVSGKVNKIDAIVDASGYRRPAIFIDVSLLSNINFTAIGRYSSSSPVSLRITYLPSGPLTLPV